MRKFRGYILYNLLLVLFFPLFACISSRRHCRRGGQRNDILQRFGFNLRPDIPSDCVWIQALSVGEVTIARVLIDLLRKEFPLPVFLTTTTITGFRTARRLLPEIPVTYFPFDLPFIWPSFLRRCNPRIFISLETEFWPNLLLALTRRNIPAVLINGRFSPNSYRRFRKVGFITAPVLAQFQEIGMRSRREADWIINLGVLPERVTVTGNIKYDVVFQQAEGINPEEVKREFLLTGRSIVFGSIHPEEEEMAVEVSQRLLSEFPGLRIIFAPRHLERSKMEAIFQKEGLKYQKFSSLRSPFTEDFLLLNVMGQLNKAYAISRAAFVGGSLTVFGDGGHNLVEPAAFAKPLAFGPHAWNFKEEADILQKSGGGELVLDSDGLYAFFLRCLTKPDWAEESGAKAYQAISRETGAAERSLRIIKKALSSN
ncbi:MAG: glycosyltransferase N-terminal domain-containing protein [Candidatus Ratteibacteria bacterium]|jgi:3-deoxy-D-manno-octulosonic-acid transferase